MAMKRWAESQSNPRHAVPGGKCTVNSGRPGNIGPDLHRRPRIIQIHPCLVSDIDIRQTSASPALEEIEELLRHFDSRGFFKAVERMWQSLEVQLPHVQIIAQNGLHAFIVDTEDMCNPLGPQVSLTFGQRRLFLWHLASR
jgi:hypothetical protein